MVENKVKQNKALFKKRKVYSEDMQTALIDSMAIVLDQLVTQSGLDTPEVTAAKELMSRVQTELAKQDTI